MKKRIISVILTSALFAFPCLGYAAEYTDLDKSNECYEAASRLRDFGIMGGYEDGSFRPDKTITRAEVARLVTSALGKDKVSSASADSASGNAVTGKIYPDYIDQGFSDVPPTHWAYEYITYLVSNGTLEGYGDGTFRPENEITYSELAKILVDITGYSICAEQVGAYPNGYMMYANNLGITEGLHFINTDNVTRSHAAMMLNKAIDVPVMVISGYTYSHDIAVPIYEIKNGDGDDYQTLLTMFHDIYTVSVTPDND